MKAIFDIMNLASDDVLPEQQVAAINAVRREFHASNALKGLCALPNSRELGFHSPTDFATAAVRAADALIAELDKATDNGSDELDFS